MMMQQPKCRICKSQFSSFDALKAHHKTEHFEYWSKVERWIDETTSAKIRSVEELAAEGMLGHQEIEK